MTEDPFGTVGVRERVLAAWAASPVRFREDANAEEDLALGGYRDRLVVELAQNAADAALRAGVPGRLLLALRRTDDGWVLVAANTGEPLDADGVTSLSTLRASAKARGTGGAASTGRFGVGFAAVLAVTDEPVVLSRSGGVRFSAADTRALLAAAGSPGLTDELARRGGHVPTLRLPFEAEGEPPVGYDTAVVLPLRDDAALEVAEHRLAEVGDALLLALPALSEVVVEHPGGRRLLSDTGARWHTLTRHGRHDPALLADRPVEERDRTAWSLTWAVPRAEQPLPGVVHAPTPTDEPLPWPALLLATFPLDPSRRHVAPGRATDALVRAAAEAYAALLASLVADGQDVAARVPTGLPSGALDAALREALVPALRVAPVLRAAQDGAGVRPRDAVVLDGPAGRDPAVVGALAPVLAGLVLVRAGDDPVLRLLDVERTTLADVVDALPLHEDAAAWHTLYAALAPASGDPLVREGLAAIPVPLADGRVVRGARGTVLVEGADDVLAGALAVLRVRAVHPAAVHPLLERLGARPARAADVLAGPEVAAALAAVRDSLGDDALDGDDAFDGDVAADDGVEPADQVADAVLALLSAAGEHATPPGEVLLRDADGELAPAAELALPGSFAAGVLDPETVGVVDPALLERWGATVLRSAGVLDGLGLVHAQDVAVGPDDPPPALEVLDGWDAWCESVLDASGAPEVVLPEVVAVRDLDVVLDDSWPAVLAHVAADPALRRAVVEPVRLRVAGSPGTVVDHPSHSAWWLRAELCPSGRVAAASADAVVQALLPPAPAVLDGLDAGLRRALGVVASLDDLGTDAVQGVVDRLADPGTTLDDPALLTVWRWLAAHPDGRQEHGDGDGADRPGAPDVVRVLGGALVPADDAVVVDAPYLIGHPRCGAAVVAPPGRGEDLADLLDLPVAADVVPGRVAAGGRTVPVDPAVRGLVPGAPATWQEHDRLVVDGAELDWWVSGTGPDATLHAATLDGLARALAWTGGRWGLRDALVAVLADPGTASAVLLDEAFAGTDPSGVVRSTAP